MKEIELVIKIPEEIRLALINNIQLSLDQQSICNSCIEQAIINGTPLPNKWMAPDVLNHLIGAEVLDKIRVELHTTAEMHEDGDFYLREEWIDEIFDKYNPLSYGKMTENCKDEEQNPFWTFK